MDAEHHISNGENPERECYSRFSDCRWETVREVFELLAKQEIPEFKTARGCDNVLANDELAADFVRLMAPHYSTYGEGGLANEGGLMAAIRSFHYSILPYAVTPGLHDFVLLKPAERDIRIWGSQEVAVLLWHPDESFASLVENGALGDLTATKMAECERRFKLALYQHCAQLFTAGDIQLADTNEYCRMRLKWPYKRLMGCPPPPVSEHGLPANNCPCPHH